jgi:hypothetical protein
LQRESQFAVALATRWLGAVPLSSMKAVKPTTYTSFHRAPRALRSKCLVREYSALVAHPSSSPPLRPQASPDEKTRPEEAGLWWRRVTTLRPFDHRETAADSRPSFETFPVSSFEIKQFREYSVTGIEIETEHGSVLKQNRDVIGIIVNFNFTATSTAAKSPASNYPAGTLTKIISSSHHAAWKSGPSGPRKPSQLSCALALVNCTAGNSLCGKKFPDQFQPAKNCSTSARSLVFL